MSYRWQDRPQGLKAHCNIQQVSSKEEVVVVAQDRHGCVPGKVEKGLEKWEKTGDFPGIHDTVHSLNYIPLILRNNMKKRGHRCWGAISCPKVLQWSPFRVILLHEAAFSPAPLRHLIHGYPGRLQWETSGLAYSLWNPTRSPDLGLKILFFQVLYLHCQWKPPPASKYGTSCRWNLA